MAVQCFSVELNWNIAENTKTKHCATKFKFFSVTCTIDDWINQQRFSIDDRRTNLDRVLLWHWEYENFSPKLCNVAVIWRILHAEERDAVLIWQHRLDEKTNIGWTNELEKFTLSIRVTHNIFRENSTATIQLNSNQIEIVSIFYQKWILDNLSRRDQSSEWKKSVIFYRRSATSDYRYSVVFCLFIYFFFNRLEKKKPVSIRIVKVWIILKRIGNVRRYKIPSRLLLWVNHRLTLIISRWHVAVDRWTWWNSFRY